MKITQKKTTFLMTSILSIIVLGTLGLSESYAHVDPAVTAGSPSVTAEIPVRYSGQETLVFLNPVSTGDVVDVSLIVAPKNSTAALDGGSITLTFPNGTMITTNMANGTIVPCVGGTNSTGDMIGLADCGNMLSEYETIRIPYTVNCDDSDVNNFQVFTGAYTGFHHATPDDALVAMASPQNTIICIDPVWNATTLANVTGSQNAPVTDPLDVVSIVADTGFNGTFTGNFTLGNSTDVFDSGDCTGGVVNATTGESTLNCQAIGTFANTIGDTCFDVTINAPSPFTPSNFTLFGSDDSENECFNIIPPTWNATTLANATGSQGDSVTDPLDVVTILADGNFTGTFDGNFTLGNSTDVFDSGDCTGGVVNSTTGIATLDCQALGTFDEFDGTTCFDVTINAPSPYTPIMETLFGIDDAENECFVVNPPEWNATTLANATGSQSDPVTDPLDVVTILADGNFTGTFTGNFTLGNSTDVFDSGDCTGGVVNSTTGIATLDCQALGTFDDEIGEICFDVTINAPSPYAPITDTLFGADDSADECFNILPPEWNATTLANATGSQSDPVTDPLDVVTILADGNFTGTFTGNFTLGNSTDVFDSGDCTGGVVNSTTGIATLDCQALGTFDDEIGEICFDVTINAPSPYAPIMETLFGTEDSENECFELRTDVPFDAYTMSNVTGIVGPTINPGDKIIINGTDGLFGNFTGNATLTFNSTDTVATTSCSSVSGDVYTLELECGVEVELTEPGQYCWDVTITETSGNYTPSVLNLFGIDDAENECFEVFEGLTPGFWKANAEKWDAGAWFEDPQLDFFNDVFNTNVELKIAKGKSDLDRGKSDNPTLFGALGARGGDENALARHCVAAKLNVENPDVTYPLTFDEVITQCGDALNDGNKTTINDLKDTLDEYNNFGSDINQHWPN